jgi:hypothetical protein
VHACVHITVLAHRRSDDSVLLRMSGSVADNTVRRVRQVSTLFKKLFRIGSTRVQSAVELELLPRVLDVANEMPVSALAASVRDRGVCVYTRSVTVVYTAIRCARVPAALARTAVADVRSA